MGGTPEKDDNKCLLMSMNDYYSENAVFCQFNDFNDLELCKNCMAQAVSSGFWRVNNSQFDNDNDLHFLFLSDRCC